MLGRSSSAPRRAILPFAALAVLAALLLAGAVAGVTLSLTQAQANGVYDTDGDKLIEISYLEQLDALRYDTDGDGAADEATDADGEETADAKAYAAAFPVEKGEVVCASDCTGYELAKSLDFEQADSYRSGAVDGTLIASSGGAGWTPILRVSSTNAKVSYSAAFEGNGYTISNLYINSEYTNRATGLFGVLGSGATVNKIGLLSVSVTGWYVLSGTLPGTGALAGRNNGTISNSYASGAVVGKNYVGGLAGKNVNTGVITKSYTAGSVYGESNVGGLVGDNLGSIVRSSSASDVTALGNFAGGLAGYSVGSIRYSYATGRVEGDTSHTQGANAIGGLLGKNLGSLNASYATGQRIRPGGRRRTGRKQYRNHQWQLCLRRRIRLLRPGRRTGRHQHSQPARHQRSPVLLRHRQRVRPFIRRRLGGRKCYYSGKTATPPVPSPERPMSAVWLARVPPAPRVMAPFPPATGMPKPPA